MVKRRSWLVANAAALLVLLVPPCALACLESGQEASGAVQHADTPCHDHEQNSDSSPTEAPSSQGDCCFESVYEAFLPGSGTSSSAGVLISRYAPWQPLEASVHGALAAPSSSRLPSRDILLLKSTLLI